MKVELTDLQVQFTLSESLGAQPTATRVEISNAGMVLLHPFMEKLFRDLGLMESVTFSHNAARCRGIYVWHYLASGFEDDADINFLLPKLLCGLSPNATLCKEVPISDFERSICSNHLCRLLRYWDLAPDIESLRRDYLGRSGTIQNINGLWTLRVDHRELDNRAEGSFQSPVTIRHAWQKEPLEVYWS